MSRKRLYYIAASMVSLLFLTGCAKKEVELAPVEIPTDVADLSKSEYSPDMGLGAYGSYIDNDVEVTFFGLEDYVLLEKESDKIKSGEKAVVVGLSAEKLRNNAAAINSQKHVLLDTMSNTKYSPKLVKDNDISQFEKVRERTVVCYRLVYAVPNNTELDNCILLVETKDGTEHIFSPSVKEEPSDDFVDKHNLCPICTEMELEKTTLVVCECADCGKQFVSAHTPAQQTCYACSVMHNTCTQCKRYIVSGINRTEKN